jgi:hypothetical protein
VIAVQLLSWVSCGLCCHHFLPGAPTHYAFVYCKTVYNYQLSLCMWFPCLYKWEILLVFLLICQLIHRLKWSNLHWEKRKI